MIPNPLTAARGFVLRKIGGRFDAARLLVSSTGHRVRTAGLGATALEFVGMVAPLVLLLLIALMLLAAHPLTALAGAKLAFPAVVAKNAKAAEFRAKAEQIRKDLLDDSKTFTKDEIEARAKDIAALEARAAYVAEFTPAEEVERQGGDEELRRANPDSDDADVNTLNLKGELEKVGKRVKKVFGGPNGYLLYLARSTRNGMSGEALKVHEQVQELAVRMGAIEPQKRSTIVGAPGDASGGEFLLPLQQVASIFQVGNEQMGMYQHATRYPVSGRTLRIPYVDQTSIGNATDGVITRPMAGIANVNYVDEAGEKPEREPKFLQRLLTMAKVAAYSEIGDETLADDFTGDLAPTVQRLVGGQCVNFINEQATIDGDGSTTGTTVKLLGALNASNGALLSIERATKGTITSDDVFNMFAQHTFGGGQSFWMIHRTALPKLFALKLSGNTLVTFLPNLQGAPQMTLLGLPIYMSDLGSHVGSKGDFALLNGGFYALGVRQALTVESSIHYKFRNDITAYRFLTRAGGIPIPTGTYSYKVAGTGSVNKPAYKQAEHSPFTQLDELGFTS